MNSLKTYSLNINLLFVQENSYIFYHIHLYMFCLLIFITKSFTMLSTRPLLVCVINKILLVNIVVHSLTNECKGFYYQHNSSCKKLYMCICDLVFGFPRRLVDFVCCHCCRQFEIKVCWIYVNILPYIRHTCTSVKESWNI